MVSESTRSRAMGIITEQLGLAETEIKDTDEFKKDLGADSLDCVEMASELEEEFDIMLESDTIRETITVGEAPQVIQTKLEA